MKIGQLSRETATKVTTIRFYESIGLLDAPARTDSGRRTYLPADADRLSFIRNGRRLGFSIEEIRSLLALADHPDRNCGTVSVIASEHLVEVDRKLADLKALRRELARLIASCEGGAVADCQVLKALTPSN